MIVNLKWLSSVIPSVTAVDNNSWNNFPGYQLAGLDYSLFQETYDWAIGFFLFFLLIAAYHFFKKSSSRVIELTAAKTTSVQDYLKPDLIEEKSPLLFIVINSEGIVKAVSEDWLNKLGYIKNNVVGHHFTDFLSKQKGEKVDFNNLFSDQISANQPIKSARFNHSSGSAIDFTLSRIVLKKNRRGRSYSLVVFDDVTAQLKAEAELQHLNRECKDQQKELDLLYQRSPGNHALIDRQFCYVRVSKEFANLQGIDPEFQLKKAIDENRPVYSDQLRNDSQVVFETGCPITNTISISKSQQGAKTVQPWIVQYDPILTSEGSTDYVLISFNEQIEEKTVESLPIVEKDHDLMEPPSKNDYLINIGHKIKTPLNAILGFTQIALNRLQSHSIADDIVQSLHQIKQGGQDLADLISHLVEYSKIEMGQSSISLERVDLQEMLMSIIETARSNLTADEATLCYHLDPQLPEYVNIDRKKLDQIIQILINNAFRKTPQEGEVCLDIGKNDCWLQFSISDQGGNIDKDLINSLLAKDQPEDPSISSRLGDTGIGLAIVKRQLDLLDGNLSIKDSEESGTTLTVQIPLIEPFTEAQAQTDLNPDRIPQNNLVLLVEDNPMNQELMRSFFRDYPFEVQIVSDGLAGMKKTKELRPDLVLMDIHMPTMNGLEAVSEIRKDDSCRNIPIIALSADGRKERQAEAFKAGFDGYLPKPFDFDELIPYLERYLKIEKKDPLPPEEPGELPQDILNKISREVEQLKSTPKDYANEILDQIETIRSLVIPHQESGLEQLKILQEMESAVFECDGDKLDQLLGDLAPAGFEQI